MLTISYAITCHSELPELQRLIQQLVAYVRPEDEIVIQQDSTSDGSKEYDDTKSYVASLKGVYKNVIINTLEFPLNKDFASFKNNIKNSCEKDYIFFLDADETLSEAMLEYMPVVVENNQVDLILVPRANTVEGLTEEHIKKWGWRYENGLVNWPDFQGRIVKNEDRLLWYGNVHERIVGYSTLTQLPFDSMDWCIHHDKHISKQERQNSLYDKI